MATPKESLDSILQAVTNLREMDSVILVAYQDDLQKLDNDIYSILDAAEDAEE